MGALKVGVTGSDGFIGSRIVARLKSDGHEVTGFDRPKDILDAADLSEFVKEKDIIVHFAALNRADYSAILKVNADGTSQLLEAIKKYGEPECRLVFASSFLVYKLSVSADSITEDKPLEPSSVYGRSKKSAEELIRHNTGNHVILRISNVYGPGCKPFYNSVIATFLQLANDGKTLSINGDGEQCRDFIFVDDVVDAVVMSLEDVTGTFNISSGTLSSLNDIISELKNALGKDLVVEYTPTDEPKSKLKIDNSRFREETGWVPKYTLAEGIKKTVEES